MKNLSTFIFIMLLSFSVAGQVGPVAVNDTISMRLEEYVTVNVLQNDYHPDGKSFRISSVSADAHSFTDSTITVYIKYSNYYFANGYISLNYLLIDEDGVIGLESSALLVVNVESGKYWDYLDANNINARIVAWGNQFYGGAEGDFEETIIYEFPIGSGKNTFFNQTLWIGGYNGQNLKLAAERFRQMGIDYWPGPLSKVGAVLSIDTATVLKWHKVWKLNVDEIVYHRNHWNDPGYEPIEAIKTWPAHGDPELNQSEYLAPFIDADDDGHYNPYSNDYPLIRGDQSIFFIFNDYRDHTETSAGIIGLEIHGMAYQFANSDSSFSPMANTVFLSYKIINRSAQQLSDTYIGLFSDIDIGFPRDDYVGCDVERGAYYNYNGAELDGNGEPGSYGENPPAQGVVILGGPLLDPNGEDDPDGGCDESITGVGFGDGVVDNERYGMTKFVYFNNNSGVQGDPQVAEEYYNTMNGIWKDGTSMEYGGNGHVSSGAYGPACNFMFPGLSDPCYWGTNGVEPFGPVEWTEDLVGNAPNDRRGLGVMGPFTLEPGAVHKVDIALVTARGANGPYSSVELLKSYIDTVKNAYYQDPDYFGYQWLGTEEKAVEDRTLNIYPNPATNDIRFSLQTEAKTIQYAVFDAFGRMAKSGEIPAAATYHIPVGELNSGVYILSITDHDKRITAKFLKN